MLSSAEENRGAAHSAQNGMCERRVAMPRGIVSRDGEGCRSNGPQEWGLAD